MPRCRSSFTLFEMIVVLALLVVLAAISIPSLDAMYGNYRVNAAVDQVRARWADGRTQAVNEGRSYRFAVVRNKGNFRLAPDSPEYWSGNPPQDGRSLVVADALPRGIRFALGDNSNEEFNNDTVIPLEDVGPDMWTGIVTFLPGGTATGADGTDNGEVRLVFQSRNGAPVVLKLRTLTSTVSVIPLADEFRP